MHKNMKKITGKHFSFMKVWRKLKELEENHPNLGKTGTKSRKFEPISEKLVQTGQTQENFKFPASFYVGKVPTPNKTWRKPWNFGGKLGLNCRKTRKTFQKLWEKFLGNGLSFSPSQHLIQGLVRYILPLKAVFDVLSCLTSDVS